MNILVTGGAGFIGSNYLNLFVPLFPRYKFINLDKLTYAANLLNLESLASQPAPGSLTCDKLQMPVQDRQLMGHKKASSQYDSNGYSPHKLPSAVQSASQ